ncbi:dihydrolipoamide acetyltransferase family protein [Citricoccus sp. GCM10030269]|uniref:dihydrolipoamide acetyltransferase family protein n=1 Tax=Citricoccus sp. GCM10030269 TaxID=3273388 RepID=UPI00361658AB
MTVRTFLLPDLGEGLTEADIVRWLVDAGDTVIVDQPIVEVETAKSLVEVPSPFGGTVSTLHAEAGTTVEVGKPLISVDDGSVDNGAVDDGAAADGSGPEEAALSYREEERAGVQPEAAAQDNDGGDGGSGNVLIGYGTPGGASTGRTRRRKSSGSGTPASRTPVASEGSGRSAQQAPRVVNPLVRKLARDRGVDLSTVQGSGPGGLIVRADVLAASGDGTGTATGVGTTVASETADSAVTTDSSSAASGEPTGDRDARTGLAVAGVEKVTGVRKVTAAAMARSRREIPEATVWVDVDVTPLMDLRAAMKARGDQQVPGLLAFASRFALAGLSRYPELAMRFEEDGEGGHRIVSFDGINLGFAVQTDRGLVVPSVRGAHQMSARTLDTELRRLTELARSGKGTPQDLSGGTFTINNYGVFGTDGSAAIINHPEVAILGLGRIIDRPWVVDGELAVRKIMQLSLVFDHRVCDGGVAGGFLRFVADCFENPTGLLAEL